MGKEQTRETSLLNLSRAKQLLAQCDRAESAKELRDKAEAARRFMASRGETVEAINVAGEIKLRAERWLGGWSAELAKTQGARRDKLVPPAGTSPKLETLQAEGIDFRRASEWERVAAIPEREFDEYVSSARAEGREITTAGAMTLATKHARQAKRDSLGDRVAALPSGKYRVIYADPPWKYGDDRAGLAGYSTSAAADHYPTMSVAELSALDVESMAPDDGVLFCWATFPLLPDALQVVEAWGYEYKTAIVWDKGRANMGNYHNACAELLLVCTRGSCTPEIDERVSQVQAIPRGKHSEKPDGFRQMIDRLYPTGPRIELFRRGAAPDGWVAWGNEAG